MPTAHCYRLFFLRDSCHVSPDDVAVASDGRVKCVPCNKVYANTRALLHHYCNAMVHQPLGLPHIDAPELTRPQFSNNTPCAAINNPSGGGQQFCKTCRKHFATPYATHTHMSQNTRNHPFYCKDCMTEFNDVETLILVGLVAFTYLFANNEAAYAGQRLLLTGASYSECGSDGSVAGYACGG